VRGLNSHSDRWLARYKGDLDKEFETYWDRLEGVPNSWSVTEWNGGNDLTRKLRVDPLRVITLNRLQLPSPDDSGNFMVRR
jgi:hypothetical protein